MANDSPSKRKRRRAGALSDSEDEDCAYVDPDSEDDGCAAPESAQEPLMPEAVEEKLEELKRLKREARHERMNVEEQVKELQKQLRPLEDEEAAIDAKQSAMAISGRNAYSRGAIRQVSMIA